ncbi:MAG: spore germination protein YaaH [Actinomycetes bacterium]|jgi:spore germination protein YaaH
MTGLKTKTAKLRRTIAVLSTVGLLSVGIVPAATSAHAVAPADSKKTQRIMSGWLPYWITPESVKSFLNNADLFSDVSPFWYNAVTSSKSSSKVAIKSNSLSSGTHASVLAQLQDKGALVMPSITDGTGTGHMSKVLRNSSRRAALVNQISNLVNSKGYDGIDLDFEKFAFSDGQASWKTTSPAWVKFIKELSGVLHANGKKLAVAVPPSGVPNGNYWVYAWPEIGPYIDKLRIMAYDYAYSVPGPVGGPLSWVNKVAAYAVSVMPANKVQLGTPTYGRDWVVWKKGTGCPTLSKKTYQTRDIGSVIDGTPASKWGRDPGSLERTYTYKVKYNGGKCEVKRSAWVPDTTTVVERAKIASRYGLNGIATWMIGSETSDQWAQLRAIARNMPFDAVAGKKSQKVKLKVSSKRGAKGRAVSLRGKVKPVRAGKKVTLHKKKSGKWVRVRTDRTSSSGKYSFGVEATGKKTKLRVKAAGGKSYAKTYKHVTLKNR